MKKNNYPCYKNIIEVVKYISSIFDTCQLDFDNNIYQKVIDNVKSNAVNMFINQNIIKSKEEIDVLSMEIIRNKKSEEFYQYQEKKNSDFSLIYVFLVPEIDYIECNCLLLQRKLYLYQGIKQYDIENQTYKFDFYNRLLKENE